MPPPLRLATRRSPLALRQAELVEEALRRAGETGPIELVRVETRADLDLARPIDAFGAHGVFVNEVERAVLEGRADAAVHSAKDLPSGAPLEGLVLAAVPQRADHRDALVGRPLAELAPGSLVATGAVRRRAQLAWRRPDLGFVGLRGNIGTRLGKIPEGGAAVVALAALERLGLLGEVAEVLETGLMLSQVGQGALALRCRADDGATRERLSAVDDPAAHRAVAAERAFLARLGGSCEAPVAAHARCGPGSSPVRIEGLIASPDGHLVLRRSHEAAEPETAGRELAELLLGADGGSLVLEARP